MVLRWVISGFRIRTEVCTAPISLQGVMKELIPAGLMRTPTPLLSISRVFTWLSSLTAAAMLRRRGMPLTAIRLLYSKADVRTGRIVPPVLET